MQLNELVVVCFSNHFLFMLYSMQAVLFCHDKVSTKDFYIPGAHFPRSAQDPVDIVHSNSDCNIMNLAVQNVDAPLPRDVPSGRKENAVIIFVLRMNKPLVRDAKM